jgi:hypothetical protein
MPSSGMGMMSEDDAAGLRKQLLRFHCISCDRPIELGAQSSLVFNAWFCFFQSKF